MLYIIYPVLAVMSFFVCFFSYKAKKYKSINEFEEYLIAALAHDLKSPASAQINMLNLLLNGQFGCLNSKQSEMLKLTRDSGKYTANLVSNVLSSYKFRSGKLCLKKTTFDIVKLIKFACEEFKYQLKEKNQSIVFNCISTECFIFADSVQIQRVLFNLLSNAITYGSVKSFIVIDLVQNEKYIEFSIMNKGIPISQKEIKNIFRKFSKTENTNLNNLSTGLGLYNSKNIIKLHQGSISAKCSPDGIFTIEFKLPVNKNSVSINNKSVV